MAKINHLFKHKAKGQPRSLTQKFMLAAAFSAALSGCGGGPQVISADTVVEPKDRIPEQPETGQIVDRQTTSWSERLANIKKQADSISRLPIIILDEDAILMQSRHNQQGFLKQSGLTGLQQWLQGQGVSLERRDLSNLFRAMGDVYGADHRSAQALKISTMYQQQEQEICLVVPESPNVSNLSLLEQWVGQSGNHEKEILTNRLAAGGAYALAERVAWHEVWHCLDTIYEPAYRALDANKDPITFGLSVHRAEMFSDVAAALMQAAEGKIEFASITGDARAVRSRSVGPRLMEIYGKAHDYQYYGGVTYYTTPGLDAVPKAFAGLKPDDRRDLYAIAQAAYEIVRNHALDEKSYRAIAAYLSTGQATDPAVKAYVARTEQAEQHLTRETGRTVLHDDNTVPPDVTEQLAAIPLAEKEEVRRLLLGNDKLAQNQPASRERIISVIEQWREAIHNPSPSSRNSDKAAERRLAIAVLMLQSGMLDRPLSDSPTPSTPQCQKVGGLCI